MRENLMNSIDGERGRDRTIFFYLKKDIQRHGWEKTETVFLSGAFRRGLLHLRRTSIFFRLLCWRGIAFFPRLKCEREYKLEE
jgi:hypothetical protein